MRLKVPTDGKLTSVVISIFYNFPKWANYKPFVNMKGTKLLENMQPLMAAPA